ncbi:3'-5' exonuclease [Sediminibacillus massiliensis]|uniref:3'-5' exonuclease n=1 Tax=Sediminibacillus massiliensis TaxID=1926277 RepID=UPI0009887193|nr:3'-5' exonuclease [Sediminibacillus massiliensis]
MLPIDIQILKYFFFEKPIYHQKIKPFFELDAYRKLNERLEYFHEDPRIRYQDLGEVSFTIFDLETTGLIPDLGHEVISIGAIQLTGLKYCRKQTFHKIIRPIRPVSKRIKDLTGIDKSEIKNAGLFIEAFDKFLDYSKGSILVAHPAKFDIRFLKTMLKRWKLPDYEPLVVDSQSMAKWLYPGLDYQLDPLIRHFGINKLERHHALNDAIMTAELFELLLERAMQNGIYCYDELEKTLKNYT